MKEERLKSLDLVNLIRHAFFAGAGYGDLERISDVDLARWVRYDPTTLGCFVRIEAALATLREERS